MIQPIRRLTPVLIGTMFAILVAGCGNPQAEKLGGTQEAVVWDAHQELFTPEAFGAAHYAAEMGDLGTAAQVATSPEFKQKVDAFEQSELPPAWEDRKAEKEAVVKALRDFIAAAESKAGAEAIRTSVTAVIEANRNLVKDSGVAATEGA